MHYCLTGYGSDCTVNCQPDVKYVDTVKFDNNISNFTSVSYNISFPSQNVAGRDQRQLPIRNSYH